MKAMSISQTSRPVRRPAYPNAADRRYHLRRLLDGLLAAATAFGAVVTILFLLML